MKILLDWRFYVLSLIGLLLCFGIYYSLKNWVTNDKVEVNIVSENKEENTKENKLTNSNVNYDLNLGSSISFINSELNKINDFLSSGKEYNDLEKMKKYKNELEKIDTFEEQKVLLEKKYKETYGDLNSDIFKVEYKDRFEIVLPLNYMFDTKLTFDEANYINIANEIEILIKDELLSYEEKYHLTTKDKKINFVVIRDINGSSDGLFFNSQNGIENVKLTNVLVDKKTNTIYLSLLYKDKTKYKNDIQNALSFLVNGVDEKLFVESIVFYDKKM